MRIFFWDEGGGEGISLSYLEQERSVQDGNLGPKRLNLRV